MMNTLDFLQAGSLILPQNTAESLNLIARVVGILSILGGIFNIVVTVCLGKSKVIIGKMVIYLALFDIITQIPLILTSINATNNRINCETIGSWFFYLGYVGSIFFTTCFGHGLYNILKDSNFSNMEVNYKKYIAVSVISGLIMATLSVIFQFRELTLYPGGQSLCQMRPVKGFNWTILIPGAVNILGCTYYYIMIIRKLKSSGQKPHWGLLVYPLILILCISPMIIRRFYFLIDFGVSDLYLQISRGLFGAQGFLNSLAYGLSREVYRALTRCCSKSQESAPLIVETSSYTAEESGYETQTTQDKPLAWTL